MKTNLLFLALGLLETPVALAQLSPNANAERDIRVVTEYLTNLTEDTPERTYTAHGEVVQADETLTAAIASSVGRRANGFTNKRYELKSAQSVVATGENAGVQVGLWGTWTATDANQKTVRLPFRHLVRLEAGRIVELHTARGQNGDGGGWWCRPLFGNGTVRMIPR